MNSLKFEGLSSNVLPERLCLFIISRNHVHFTGVELHESAAWGSWFQLFHLITKTEFKGDFLKNLHLTLKKISKPIKYSNASYKPSTKIPLLDYSIKVYIPAQADTI